MHSTTAQHTRNAQCTAQSLKKIKDSRSQLFPHQPPPPAGIDVQLPLSPDYVVACDPKQIAEIAAKAAAAAAVAALRSPGALTSLQHPLVEQITEAIKQHMYSAAPTVAGAGDLQLLGAASAHPAGQQVTKSAAAQHPGGVMMTLSSRCQLRYGCAPHQLSPAMRLRLMAEALREDLPYST